MELDAVPTDIRPAFEQVVDHGGNQIPLHQHPFFKEAKDWPTFAKGAFDAHREVGARIPVKIEKTRNVDGTFIPKADSVAQWRKDHMPKLYEAGILQAPPADVKEYGIVQSEAMKKAEFPWSDEFGGEFGKILQKYDAPKEMAGELMKLHDNVLLGAHKVFSGQYEEGVGKLKQEYGGNFEVRADMANRLARQVFKSDADREFAEVLLKHNADFLGIMMRLGHLAESDSSFVRDMNRGGGGGMTAEEVRAAVTDIATNKANPMNAGYHSGDPTVRAHVESLYAKISGANQSMNVGEGIEIKAAPGRA